MNSDYQYQYLLSAYQTGLITVDELRSLANDLAAQIARIKRETELLCAGVYDCGDFSLTIREQWQ